MNTEMNRNPSALRVQSDSVQRPRDIIFARSGASLRSIVAALMHMSNAAPASLSLSSPSRRSNGATRFTALTLNTAELHQCLRHGWPIVAMPPLNSTNSTKSMSIRDLSVRPAAR